MDSQSNPPIGQLTPERRKACRYCCKLKAARTGAGTVAFKPSRLARVVDISSTGIAIHVGAWFDVGTILSIRLCTAAGESVSDVMDVTVVRAEQQNNGTWIFGSQFVKQLPQDELQKYLSV
jgi:PilZ domain